MEVEDAVTEEPESYSPEDMGATPDVDTDDVGEEAPEFSPEEMGAVPEDAPEPDKGDEEEPDEEEEDDPNLRARRGLAKAKAKEYSARKAAEERAERLEAQLGRLQQLVEPLYRKAQQDSVAEAELAAAFARDAEEGEAPDPEESPVDALFYQQQQILRRLDSQRQGAEAKAQQEAQQRAQESLTRAVADDAQRFVQETPDYPQAFAHFRDRAVEGWKRMGYDQGSAERAFAAYSHQVVLHALQTRQRPAAVVYEMAKANGWTPQNGTPQPAPGQNGRRGKRAQPAPSIGGTTGRSASATALPDFEELLSYESEAAFAEALDRLGGEDRVYKAFARRAP